MFSLSLFEDKKAFVYYWCVVVRKIFLKLQTRLCLRFKLNFFSMSIALPHIFQNLICKRSKEVVVDTLGLMEGTIIYPSFFLWNRRERVRKQALNRGEGKFYVEIIFIIWQLVSSCFYGSYSIYVYLGYSLRGIHLSGTPMFCKECKEKIRLKVMKKPHLMLRPFLF